MLNSLAKAIGGTVEGDRIITEKGTIACSLVGRITLTAGPGNTGNRITLGHVSVGIPAIVAAYEKA